MITYRLGLFQYEEERARELVEAIKRNPGSCETVWFTTMGYYPPLWKHEEYAAAWEKVLPIYKEAGLKVSIQVANTMGHTQWAQLDPEKKDLFALGMIPKEGEESPYLVGPDGVENYSCFCTRSEKFRGYINSLLTIYAKALKPERLWFDDDLRAHHHRPVKYSCYCDRCIAEFNRQNGTEFTREALVKEINYGDLSLRRKYIDFIRAGIYDFVYGACKAVLSVSPDTSFGLENEHEHNYLGANDDHIVGALHDASGKEVHTRPGGGYYNDKAPYGQFVKSMLLSSAISVLPDYVTEYVAEMENLPGVAYGKSIGGIINEGTVDMAVGCTGLTLTDVQSCHEPMSYYERIFAAVAKARPYWEKLREVSKNGIRTGASIYWGEAPELRPLTENDQPFLWDNILIEADVNLLRLGIPVTYDQRLPGAYLIHHNTVDGLTDKDIEFLLTKPVIADGESVAKIIERGYGDRFAFTMREITNDGTSEHFTDCEINGEKGGQFYNENPYAAGKPMKRYAFDNTDSSTVVLGKIHNGRHLSDGKYLGDCTVVTEVKKKDGSASAKWAIFAYSIWSDIVSSAKRNQIVGALDAIAEGGMAVRLLTEEQAVIYPSVDKENKVIAFTVSAASQSGAEILEVKVRRPKGENISIMGARRNDVKFKVEKSGSEEILVTLYDLVPYETVTVFFE